MAKASDLVNWAVKQIGTTEYPPNSNNVRYNTDYYGREVYDGMWGTVFPWCCTFIWDGYREIGASDLYYYGRKTASCPTLAGFFQYEGEWVTTDFKPGDVIFYDWGIGGYGYDHVGIVESVNDDGSVNTIEGNTSLTSNDNGGNVMRRVRYRSEIVGAGRSKFDPEPEPKEDEDMERYNRITELPEWAQPTIMKLCDKNYLRGQGGPRDEAGRPADLDLSMDVIRVFVILDRAGQFGDRECSFGSTETG